ncbi:MAG TPA: amidohydrolase family protein, partial [Myxococcales bacterium]|nr:amidohydrolase family protein [Myxococcales bacterium]
RVEHAQVLRLEDIPRLAKAGLVASMQPTHATSDMPWAEQRLGHERAKGAYAWKSVLEAGAPLAFGSDFPIESPAPLWGLYAARTRQDANGKPEGGWFPEQRLSGEQALAAFTTGAAYASFAEGERGRLAPGMEADFTALSVDPVEAPPVEVRNGKVVATVVGGREVFRAP